MTGGGSYAGLKGPAMNTGSLMLIQWTWKYTAVGQPLPWLFHFAVRTVRGFCPQVGLSRYSKQQRTGPAPIQKNKRMVLPHHALAS